MDWFLYLIRCRDGSLYTGITTDVERRFREHEEGARSSAKYLRGRGPLELVLAERIGEHGSALRAEARIRRLPKERKEALLGKAGSVKAFLSES